MSSDGTTENTLLHMFWRNQAIREQEDPGSVYPLNAKSWQAAQRECAYLMGYSKKFRVFLKKGKWYCTDKGV